MQSISAFSDIEKFAIFPKKNADFSRTQGVFDVLIYFLDLL